MVDVSAKARTERKAVAAGRVILGEPAFRALVGGSIAKGDVLSVAQVAGISAAKQTGALIPLCHNVFISAVDVDFALDESGFAVDVRATATAVGTTGVEMEALVAVSVAALTIYDMCKSASKAIRVSDIRLLSKTGGKSGTYRLASTTT